MAVITIKSAKHGTHKVFVDDADFKMVSKFKWCLYKGPKNKTFYAIAHKPMIGGINQGMVRMHRILLNSEKGEQVDHINGNGLDNRRKNLRKCTNQQNNVNRGIQSNNTSGYKGVYWCEERGVFHTQIKVNGKHIHLGSFGCPQKAAKVYNKSVKKYFGEFAKLNKI